jgi:hypothetical protein
MAILRLETVGSLLPGYTKNRYDLTRAPAGSSSGTAAAVAAHFGVRRQFARNAYVASLGPQAPMKS